MPHGVFRFSATEVRHLLIGTLLVVAAGLTFRQLNSPFMGHPIALSAAIAVFAAAFLVHELAHKYVAQNYGLWAEFRVQLMGALLTLLTLFAPFKLIAPGAVVIAGPATLRAVGRVGFAGPLTNIVMGWTFYTVHLAFAGVTQSLFLYGALINSWLAVFNLLPFSLLDGQKIFAWNKPVWAMGLALSLSLGFLTYTAL